MMNIAPANATMPNTGKWQDRHNDAMRYPHAGFESAIVHLLNGWVEYASHHRKQYISSIGDDGVLGPEWWEIGKALRHLLNGETGRLDCGTLDAFILDTMVDTMANHGVGIDA